MPQSANQQPMQHTPGGIRGDSAGYRGIAQVNVPGNQKTAEKGERGAEAGERLRNRSASCAQVRQRRRDEVRERPLIESAGDGQCRQYSKMESPWQRPAA